MGGSGSKLSAQDQLVDKSNKLRALPDNILNMMFSTIKMRDILELSSVDKCQRYVFLTKEALEKAFYQLDVEPKAGVPIYFAPVDELALSRQRDPEQAQRIPARNQNCMRVAFFYIRAFQILGALSINLFDTIPLRTFSTGAAARVAAIPTQVGQPGRPRQLGGAGQRGVVLGAPSRENKSEDNDYFKGFVAITTLLPSILKDTVFRAEGDETTRTRKIIITNPTYVIYKQNLAEKEELDVYGAIDVTLDDQGQGTVTIPYSYKYQIRVPDAEPSRFIAQDGGEKAEKYITFTIVRDPSDPQTYRGKFKVNGTEIEPEFTTSFAPTQSGKRGSMTNFKFDWNVPPLFRNKNYLDLFLAAIFNTVRSSAGVPEPLPPPPSRLLQTTTQTYTGPTAPVFQPTGPTVSFAGPTIAPTTTGFPSTVSPPRPTVQGIQTTAPFAPTATATTSSFVPGAQPITGPTAQARFTTGPIQSGEFIAFAELKRRLLDEKVSPKAYAIGRAMLLLNPAHPAEQLPTTQFSSDVCRPNRTPPEFDLRLKAMPLPQSQSRGNLYFQSLVSLYYDSFKIQSDGRLIIEQTPPGREALIQASLDLGLMFYVAGGQAEQVKFLYDAKVIQFPPNLCPQNGALLVFSKDPKYNAARSELVANLRKITSTLFAHQDKYNAAAIQVLKKLFYDTKEKEFRIRAEVYKGGIPAMNKIADEARRLLLDYYRKSEAYYTLGVQAIVNARQKTPGLIEYASI